MRPHACWPGVLPVGAGLAGTLCSMYWAHGPVLQQSGEILYNGEPLAAFVPERTAAYVDQSDLSIPDMTVRETFDFSARCQGSGSTKAGAPLQGAGPGSA